MMRCTIFALLLGLVGCGQREQSSVSMVTKVELVESVETPTIAAAAPVVAPMPRTVEPKPTFFEYPDDLAGQSVAKAVTPAVPFPPTEKFGGSPKPRTPPARMLNPEPTVKANYTPPPIDSVKPGSVALSPPREQVPVDLGAGATLPPVKPSLPVAAGITERARDVSIPPAMPLLGRPLNDRASLEDPTSEFANSAIVAPGVKAGARLRRLPEGHAPRSLRARRAGEAESAGGGRTGTFTSPSQSATCKIMAPC